MVIFKKHPGLVLLAVFMPIVMMLVSDNGGAAVPFVSIIIFFTFMLPMQYVRAKGNLPMSEFMVIGAIMMASWIFAVVARVILIGIVETMQNNS